MESERIRKLYSAVSENDWEAFQKYWAKEGRPWRDFHDLTTELSYPLSIQGDNIIRLAVYSGSKQPLDLILSSVQSAFVSATVVRELMEMSMNEYGNTVLHEAAIRGNLGAVKLLVGQHELYNLLDMANDAEETPLFIAAANGNTKIVKYLASQPGQTVNSDAGKKQLKDIHRKNKSGDSVLYVAVQGQHFGTALELLELDEELANLANKENETSLYMLAKIPSALKSENQIGIWKKLVFFCLPARDNGDYNNDVDKIEIKGFYPKVWNIITKVCSIAKNIWKEKRNHEFACALARKLAKKDKSWEKSYYQSMFTFESVVEEERRNLLFPGYVEELRKHLEQLNLMIQNILHVAAKEEPGSPLFADIVKIILEKYPQLNREILLHVAAKEPEEETEIPLFAAIRAGNVKLVEFIVEEYPQQLEGLNRRRQNILHLAAMYRQKEIFDIVKSKQTPLYRMARQIDIDGYTVLHSVADTKHYKGGTGSHPAYQLQDELKWFNDVKDIIPSNYTIRKDHNNKTAEEILKEKHAEQLKNAQTWIKDTSQSCSGVAVLVATVVFAAAFTVPGGNNESNGLPVLLNSTAFLVFTTLDVIALSCSLASVLMFLSILTSPFELENFRVSLPRRLTIGFFLLFMAVATTMFTFASTIFLIIQPDQPKQWKMTFICSAAFFPVSVLALAHFPLLTSSIKLLAFPCRLLISCLKSLGSSNKSGRKQAHGDT